MPAQDPRDSQLSNPSGAIVKPARAHHDRISIACRRCHDKKIRCDATGQSPCTNCAFNGDECVLIESRRGKYVRKRRTSPTAHEHEARSRPQPRQTKSHGHNGSPDARAGDNITVAVHSDVAAGGSLRPISPEPSGLDDSPESFYADIAERSIDEVHRPGQYAEDTVFLGETFSLTYVVNDVLAPFLKTRAPARRRRLHFPTARRRAEGHLSSSGADDSDVQSLQARAAAQVHVLKTCDLYRRPPHELCKKLLDLYHTHFHPAFPILPRAAWSTPAHAERQSQLVWTGMLMVAVTLCDDQTIQESGFPSRHVARAIFYRQTRCLYDRDMEQDPLNVIRAAFLMSFWWGGPNDMKDSKHWMGIAISMAQAQGLHRTTRWSNMAPAKASMWKRLWWSLRARDVLISASIGRPQFAWRGDCDLELPVTADVAEEVGSGYGESASYFLSMAQLSALVSRIIDARYAPDVAGSRRETAAELEQAMEEFWNDLTPSLKRATVEPGSGTGFWAAMLALAHGYGMILLCRPTQARTPDNGSESAWGNPAKAIASANAITRTTEDLLSSSMMNFAQVHSIAAIFNALAIHVFLLCTTRGIARAVAESRAKMCMIGLSSLQQSWPVGGWVLKLFEHIMWRLSVGSNSTARNSSNHAAQVPALPQATAEESRTATRDSTMANGVSATHDCAVDVSQTADVHNGDESLAIPLPAMDVYPTQWSDFADTSDHIPDMLALSGAFEPNFSNDQFFDWLDFRTAYNDPREVWHAEDSNTGRF